MHLIRARLRDVPVLAEKAAHVAAGRAHRKHACPGQKMIQWLLLDWIDLQRGRVRVAEAIKLPAFVCANEAETGLPLANVAVPRTQVAMDLAVRRGLPPSRFIELLRFVRGFDARHMCLTVIIRPRCAWAAASEPDY